MATPRLRRSVVRVLGMAAALACGSISHGAPPDADGWGCSPMDWPHWRGPEYNGISREKNLPAKWTPDGENLIWKRSDLATRSTPIAMGGRLYFLQNDRPATPEEGEKVVCADAATGDVIWENRFNVFLSDVPDTRVGWSSVVGDPDTGNVYALGVCGVFRCIDRDGKTVWERSLSEEYGLLSTYGGRTNFPVVVDDLVIISAVIIGWDEMAKPAHRFVAFDKKTGVPRWFTGTRPLPEDTTYSSPVPTVLNGQKVIVFASGDGGVYAFQARTGKQVLSYQVSLRGINTTPLVVGDTIYCGHSEENTENTSVMGAFFALDGKKSGDLTKGGALWKAMEVGIGRAGPILINDRIYAIDDAGTLFVVNPKTGKTIGKQKLGTIGWGSPVYADGKIYCCERNGRWYAFEPTDKGVKPLDRLRLDGEEVNSSPIVSRGRIYLATNRNMYCIGLADAKPEADDRPAPPQEAKIADDEKPAQVQVVPVEVILKPGQSQQFEARLFNSKGQFLGTAADLKVNVEFSAAGPGKIDADGNYASPEKSGQAAVHVTAKMGEISGQARIRIVPNFPWSYDFDDGQVPVTWVGMRYRHIAVDGDLFQKLRKSSPLAADLYVYVNTSFANSGLNKAKYQDVGPVQRWTEMLRFTDLLGKITNDDDAKALQQAKVLLEPAIKLLVDEKILAKAVWGTEGGVFLAVEQGPRKVEGNGVMCKITTIPKGTRSQGWMGHTDFRNYTVQADVYGTGVPSAAENPAIKMPDIGLIAQRYRFELMGASQELKIYSWVAHEIKFKTIPFPWKPDVWYTMKLQASVEKQNGRDVAVLKGKVWERGQKEPTAWSIEWTDAPANAQGSPGLVGNAKDAEIFFDNVKVTPNGPESTAKTE